MPEYILVHDVRSGGNKAVLVHLKGGRGRTFEPYETHYPESGWAEQEPEDWWRAIALTTRRLLEKTAVQPNRRVP